MNWTRRFISVASVALALWAALPLGAEAQSNFGFTLTPKSEGIYDLSWTAAVDPASTTAKVTYFVKSRQFNLFPSLANGTTVFSVLDETKVTGLVAGHGTFCAIVLASTTVSGFFAQSVIRCKDFVHAAGCGGVAGVIRSDALGQQLGFGQTWSFKYFIDDDAEVTFKVFDPLVQFYTDPVTGFSTTTSVNPVKVLVSSIPRSGELGGCAIFNTETWDSRYSTGAVVPNGLYTLYAHFRRPLSGATNPRWEGALTTIPVDIIRITAFTTQGITTTDTIAKINYTITADSSVRIVIAQPGRVFTIDSNGDVQAVNSSGQIDTSIASVVQVITFNRKAGSHVDTWNGTDSLGVAVSSGVYPVAISAKDGFGNKALGLTGNSDGPIATTIPLDRTASQQAGDVTAPTVSGITLKGVSLGSSPSFLPQNPQVTAPIQTITITLSESPGTGVNASSVVVTGPLGDIAASTSASGNDIIWTATAAFSTAGDYQIKFNLKDTTGNTFAPTSPIPRFSIAATGSQTSAPVTQTQENFRNSVVGFPNPAKGAGSTRINFKTVAAATLDIDIFTIMGERVFHETKSFPAGSNSFRWDLVNNTGSKIGTGVYLIRLTSSDGNQTLSATRKMVIVK